MNIYITRFNAKILGKSFMNLRSLRFIDVVKIIEGYDNIDNEYIEYVVSKSIKDTFMAALKSKRYNGIVYSNPNLTDDIVSNIKQIIPEGHDFIFIDEKEDNMDEISKNFSKILFFPSGNRKRILRCTPIANPLFYWLNGIEQ